MDFSSGPNSTRAHFFLLFQSPTLDNLSSKRKKGAITGDTPGISLSFYVLYTKEIRINLRLSPRSDIVSLFLDTTPKFSQHLLAQDWVPK